MSFATTHAKDRCKRRFGFALNKTHVATILKMIKAGKADKFGPSRTNIANLAWGIDFKGHRILIITDDKLTCIVTVMDPSTSGESQPPTRTHNPR